MKKKSLKWYAIEENFNNRTIVQINVLSDSIVDDIKSRIKKDKATKFEDIKGIIKSVLMSAYWSRTEHEVLVSGLFNQKPTKIDVWFQLEPNLDRITEYVIKELNIKED